MENQSYNLKERLSSLSFLTLLKSIFKFLVTKFAVTGGLRLWLIKFVSEKLVEAGDEYLLEPALRKIGFIRNVKDGEVRYVKRINSKDSDEWRDSVRDR